MKSIICLIVGIVLFVLSVVKGYSQESVAEQWKVFELTLIADSTYEDPYQEDLVCATFTGPEETSTIIGFWDGGNTWKVRVVPSELGAWSYFTTSNDPGLVTSGSFTCVGSNSNGGIQPMEDFPYHFQYENGIPFWWFGETCWAGFRSDPLENLSSDTFKEYVDVRASQGFNYIHINALTGPNEGGEPFIGGIGNSINPTFWQEVDERVEYLNDKGITVGFMLSWKSDNAVLETDWTDFPDQDSRKRYCEYLASRYSAYNVLWILSGEYDEAVQSDPNSLEDWAELAGAISSADSHDRMMSIHGTG